MILKDPYESRLLKLVNKSQTLHFINTYIAIDYAFLKEKEKIKIKPFVSNDIILNPVILYGLSDIEKNIPSFDHPIINKENNWIALDLRKYVKLNDTKNDFSIRNESEYYLNIERFILTGMWHIEKYSSLYSLKFGHIAFASWLSENLTRKFGLDLNNQLQLKILSLIYYTSLFTNMITEDDIHKLIIRTKEDIVVPSLIEEVYSKAESLNSIDDFCNACYEVTNNVRLKGLDFNILLNILSNNWLGSNSKELVMVALEHPPTWLSLVHASLTQRSFKKCFIATIVDKLDKRGKGQDFLNTFSSITNNYK